MIASSEFLSMNDEETRNESDLSVLEEIEALKAILFTELDVTYSPRGRPLEFQHTLYPSTADDTNQHYVCLTLVMKFPLGYPDQQPTITLKNPRGLGDEFLANALRLCNEKCAHFSGSPVIYEIIELLRECLTNSNRPTGHCTICLFHFQLEDVFTYTQCYHHFHSHCLARFCESLHAQWEEEDNLDAINNPRGANWKEKKLKQFTCPVCREAIIVELASLKLAPPPLDVENFHEEFQRDAKYAAWRKQMDAEYQRQKIRGGIIDKDMEDSRFLVVTENTSVTLSSISVADAMPVDEGVQSQTRPQIKPVQASAAVKLPAASKPEWSRSHQRRPPRGKWFRSSERKMEERPDSAQNIVHQSNPQNRQTSTENHPSRTRFRAEEPMNSNASQSSEPSRPAHIRSPAGFAPR